MVRIPQISQVSGAPQVHDETLLRGHKFFNRVSMINVKGWFLRIKGCCVMGNRVLKFMKAFKLAKKDFVLVFKC